jgi:formylglycine-generating enzyme required for sulfatase activity/serine/threonine protein kinase
MSADPGSSQDTPKFTTGGRWRWEPPTAAELQAMMPGYTIERLLGRGGMGAVYKGIQVSLERPVAIKILPPGLDLEDASFTARFKNEAKLMAKLLHPAIVAVFDFGQTSAGQLFIVMEHVDGTDISRMIAQQGHLSPEHALAIAAHVCDALTAAHELGIVHRDIKPANVLISRQGQVKVADFGLAKIEVPGQHGLTKTGTAMGTPDFVAPEALITGTHIDGRADLYSVGVMLYQMLTGEVPRGSWKPATQRVAGIDPRFDAIVLKAMQQDREERYQSSSELRRDLDVILTVPLVQSEACETTATASSHPPAAPTQHRELKQPGEGIHVSVKPSKSQAPIVIGFVAAAAIAVGTFVFFNGSKPDVARYSKAENQLPPDAQTAVLESQVTPKPELPSSVKTEPPKIAQSTPVPTTPAPTPPTTAATKAETKPVAVPMPDPVVTAPAVAPTPVSTAAPRATTELDQRLAALETAFQAAAERDAGATFKASMSALDKSYLGALDRALAAATQGGKLEEALVLRGEKQRVEQGGGVPSEVDEGAQVAGKASDALKNLRKTYHRTMAQHETTKVKSLQPLYDKYDQALAALQTELTKANKLDDAMRVKVTREQLASTRSGLQPPGASPVASTPSGPAPPAPGPAAGGNATAFTNSLGMQFVPVPGTEILMCVHETRRKDYAVFAAETPGFISSGPRGEWMRQQSNGIPVGDKDDHPVVAVSWDDAKAFCAWLSKRDGRDYRLPYDKEWSVAVELREKAVNALPVQLDQKRSDEYPWGNRWPPLKGAGNYADSKLKELVSSQIVIDGYTDGFATTAPVMSFKPNKHGLFDLGGNVWEWCEDWYDDAGTERVMRGGSWNFTDRSQMLSSYRLHNPPDTRDPNRGFRIVAETRSPRAEVSPAVPAPVPATATKSDYTNSLGMQFVKVPGTKVLFCIHETRRQDYAAYAADVAGVDTTWMNVRRGDIPCGHEDSHPVVGVGWEDARAYCQWLARKEGKTYRLPTDHEWSFAVGIGREEKRTKDTTPESLNQKVAGMYPWGGDYPPRTRDQAGNYSDMEWKNKFFAQSFIADYTDGFATTSPVMCFKPNKLGLYDMGGNVWEWVEDFWNAAKNEWVLRGASYANFDSMGLLSSSRHHSGSEARNDRNGFRIVLEVTD